MPGRPHDGFRSGLACALLVLTGTAACSDDSTEPARPSASTFPTPVTPSTIPPISLVLRPVVQLTEGEAIAVVSHPTDDDGLLVVDRRGRIVDVVGGKERAQPWLDLRDRVSRGTFEQGMLGLAVGDDVAYVSFTDHDDAFNVVEYRLDAAKDPIVASEREVLHVPKPAKDHNGGRLQLTADGMLWIGLGDGGHHGDGPHGDTAQDLSGLFGSILRIDPRANRDRAYTIPADNPFVGRRGVRAERYVFGLRNPWGYWVDETNGDLWIGDVGQEHVEEIDLVPKKDAGANLGWPFLEGRVVERPESRAAFDGKVFDPLIQYPHGKLGCAVIGGAIVRGGAVPAVEGAYLYGDLCGRTLRALRVEAGIARTQLVARTNAELTSVNVFADGRVFVTTRKPGAVFLLASPGR